MVRPIPQDPFEYGTTCSVAAVPQEHLRLGETVVWAGRPCAPVLSPGHAWITLLGAFLGAAGFAFALYGFMHVFMDGSVRWLTALQGLLNIVLGIGFCFAASGALLRSAWTVYAVTDQRAMIIKRFLWSRVISFEAAEIEAPQRIDCDEGLAHVIFAWRKKAWLLQDKASNRMSGVGFFRIEGADSIVPHLLQLRATIASTPASSAPAAAPS